MEHELHNSSGVEPRQTAKRLPNPTNELDNDTQGLYPMKDSTVVPPQTQTPAILPPALWTAKKAGGGSSKSGNRSGETTTTTKVCVKRIKGLMFCCNQVAVIYDFRDIDTCPDSVGRCNLVLGVAGTKPGCDISQATPVGSVHVSNYPKVTIPKHISGLTLSITRSAGPLVTALAVLWSVVRLYDLLKSSALASGTVCQKAKPLEYKLNEGDGPSAGRLPQAVWPHVQHVEQRDRGCVVTREYCNDIQNRRSNL